jgi:AP-1-like factor
MTSTRYPLQDLILTPQQQSLLYAALNSNRQNNPAPSNTPFQAPPLQFDGSPVQGSGSLSSFQNSPDLDYDYDFAGADSSFDFPYEDGTQPKMIGDLPGTSTSSKSDTPDSEGPEKRSHPEDGESPGAKRRESEEKVAKKPGRKPLTTEPSSVSSLGSVGIGPPNPAANMLDRSGRPRIGPPSERSGSARKGT